MDAQNQPLSFRKILPLRELAAMRVTIALCGHLDLWKIHHIHHIDYENCEENVPDMRKPFVDALDEKNSDALVKSLNLLHLPVSVRVSVENFVMPVIVKVKLWKVYQCRRIFAVRKPEPRTEKRKRVTNNYNFVFDYANKIVWKSDGDIDYQATALNMLSDSSINAANKFKIASVYCLQEEVEKMRPMLADLEQEEFDNLPFHEHPLLIYWFQVLKSGVRCRSDREMFPPNNNVDNVHAIMYFWNGLDSNEQVDRAASLITNYGLKFLNDLISRMTRSQQESIFSKMGHRIIFKLAGKASYHEIARSAWLRFRRLIDEQVLVAMIEYLEAKCRRRLVNSCETAQNVIYRNCTLALPYCSFYGIYGMNDNDEASKFALIRNFLIDLMRNTSD